MSDTTENPNEETIKCVVVGDNNVGKTRLICSRAYNEEAPNNRCNISTSHVPTVWAIDQYRNNQKVLDNARCNIDGTMVSLRLWDTFGDHHKNRRFAFGKADVIIVCFSVCDERSLRQVTKFWLPEVRKHNKNIPVLLVACKVDLRFAELREKIKCKGTLTKAVKHADILFPEQCRYVAMETNCPYYESSVLLGYGINDVFENACRAALLYRRNLNFWNSSLKRIQRLQLQPPLQPPKPSPPNFPHLDTKSPLLPNLFQMYKDNVLTDVVLISEGEKIFAHKVVLCASSSVFAEVFTSPVLPATNDAFVVTIAKSGNTVESYKRNYDITHHSIDDNQREVYESETPTEILKILVNFCYTGLLMLETPDVSILTQIIIAGQKFAIPELVNLVADLLNSMTFDPRPHEGFMSRRAASMKSLFIETPTLADVVFHLDDGSIPGHKVLLASGCDVMMAMFTGSFIESGNKEVDLPDTTTTSLRCVLEFIYTNNIPELDCCATVYDVIKLADRLCLPRLISRVCCVVVDMFIKDERKYFEKNEKCLISKFCTDVIMMSQIADLHNAPELRQWCLYFLSIHYNDACRSIPKIMKSLPPPTLSHLEEHRWPPVWFIKQQDVYDKSLYQRKEEESGRKYRK